MERVPNSGRCWAMVIVAVKARKAIAKHTRTEAENDVCPAKDGLDRLDRVIHDELYSDGTRHVIDMVGLADKLFHESFVEYSVNDQSKILAVFEMRDV